MKYFEAINQVLHDIMCEDSTVILMGQGITSPWYVGGTCTGLLDRFGPDRVIDTPVSENSITGAAIGAAIAGLRPILVFPRMDFMLYAMDPIINHAAMWSYMFGGRARVPMVIWAIINRGGSQGCQHSQDLRWIFKNIPGLKWTEPFTPYQAAVLLRKAVRDDNPVIFFDDRERYNKEDDGNEVFHSGLHEATGGPPVPCSETLEKEWFKKYEDTWIFESKNQRRS